MLQSFSRFKPFVLKAFDYGVVLLASATLPVANALLPKRIAVPPRFLWFIGNGDFETVGAEFLTHFRTIGGLTPDMRVLDIGCGLGRMAIPLTSYLSSQGSYVGFDIVDSAVDWCTQRIARLHPGFSFFHADLKSNQYNRNGTRAPHVYRIPLPDESFDFIIMTSVATHILPASLENYLEESYRVLREGGRVFFTSFLLNAGRDKDPGAADASIEFGSLMNSVYAVADATAPERAVAYSLPYLLELSTRLGYSSEVDIRAGTWSGWKEGTTFQDIIVLTKTKS